MFRGREVILAAGALATPQLLLASELGRLNPGGQVIGRYLQRHYNEILFGIFPTPPNPGGGFHKQIGIHDFYFGHSLVAAPTGSWAGCSSSRRRRSVWCAPSCRGWWGRWWRRGSSTSPGSW